MRKFLSMLLAVVMLLGVVASASAAEEIYYLNFKPEIAEVYAKVAAAYEAATGNKVKVETAASGTYEQTLRSEVAKADAPVIFQINGPVGLQSWKDYCMDLSKTELYNMLSDKSLAVSEGDCVYGVPYVVEGYGIIYNNAIMAKYFASANKTTSYASMDEITGFDALAAVVEDMTALKGELGIEGVFASTSMAAGDQWRWQTHLMNLPLYYEFSEGGENSVVAGLAAKEITFKYGANYQNIFDLYTNNSVTAKGLLSNKSTDDSMAEFALGKCAMVQNGNWGASQILGVSGNTVANEDIKFLPIYTGVAGEETQGLCIGTENYLCINSKVSPEKQQAAVDFLVWLFSSDEGKAFVKNDLMFLAPFNTFKDDEKPEDPLSKEVLRWMEKDGAKSVAWTFAAFPSEEFKNYVGDALLEYLQGGLDWAGVTQVVVDSWASEKAM
ncbi:MAG: ABC transporter substrate-binding protein [Clostridia bacterium]